MSEQQGEPTTTTAIAPVPSDPWGQPISLERQVELQRYLDRWQAETDHGERKGPFDKEPGADYGVLLTGADVFWLAEQSGRDARGLVPNLHLEGANLAVAHLERANLGKAHLERASLLDAHLRDARLIEAHLEHAELFEAFLGGANLAAAHLGGANLLEAHLEGANLQRAYLEGTSLQRAYLEHADLTGAFFDKASRLNDAILTGVSLDQVSFDQTNLTVVDWSLVQALGDEQTARTPKDANGKSKGRSTRLTDYKSAVRANRILAVVLQAQGLSEDASRFAYHAQVLQREVYSRQRNIGAYLFSLLIAALSGYGYRLGRILIAYALIVSVFATGFFFTGHTLNSPTLSAQSLVQGVLDAFQISLNAIHGRVFFAQFGLDTVQSWFATAESIVGIVIEGVFVAMLIQRFFGR